MNAPRLRIDLAKIQHNARVLVRRLGACGIQVTGVTKAGLGDQAIAQAMRLGGVRSLGDSRLRNIRALSMVAHAEASDGGGFNENRGSPLPVWLLRSPMLSESAETVGLVNISCNTELDILDSLSTEAVSQCLIHQVVLMIELGDLREGIVPGRLHAFIHRMMRFPGVQLVGIGTNLGCLSGVIPDARNMAELSSIASAVEHSFAMRLGIVSGGNSANLNWASGLNVSNIGRPGHVNNLRLGEAILLGREASARQAVPGLHTDAFSLVAEVIESKLKPCQPCGTVGQMAIGVRPEPPGRCGQMPGQHGYPEGATRNQSILALGVQDVDAAGLTPPIGIRVLGASSDHLIIDTGNLALRIGSEVSFTPDYSALMRAMTSPFVSREWNRECLRTSDYRR